MNDGTRPEDGGSDPEGSLQQAFRLYQEGESVATVAKRFGFSVSTLTRRMQVAGISIRTKEDSHRLRIARADEALLPQLAEAIRRYEEGEPARWLAEEFGIGYGRFIRLLIQTGVQQRTIRENLAIMYAKMSPEERKEVAAAANASKRGRPANLMSLERRAQTMERTLQLASRYDLLLGLWLAQRSLKFVPQKAIGRYNLDLAVTEHSIAVEVNGPGHWSGKDKWAERCQYLFTEGWRVIEVRVKGPISDLREGAADRICALIGETGWGDCVRIDGHGDPYQSTAKGAAKAAAA